MAKSSRHAIFAALALLGHSLSIKHFVEFGIFDCHLPFKKERTAKTQGGPFWTLYNKSGQKIDHKCSEGWKPSEVEQFVDTYQWQVLAPYFAFAAPGREVHHYDLDWPKTILPFIRDTEEDGKEETTDNKRRQMIPVTGQGGYSKVSQALIHGAHHDPSHPGVGNKTPGTLVAIKKLHRMETERKGGDDEQYRRRFFDEVRALQRCSDRNHPYLIHLLMTYNYKHKYRLVFRWADCNLMEYWEMHPNVEPSGRSYEFANWVAEEWHGIAGGLEAIHNATPRGSGRHHGRHGDLKPTNILWFQQGHLQSKYSGFGKFVISDFGFTEFHAEGSKDNVDAATVGRTDTYRPPECDVRSTVGPSYDIWTLGCILQEFCVWYLKGYDAVVRFGMNRVNDEGGPASSTHDHVTSDTFFLPESKSETQRGSDPPKKKAQIKRSVCNVSAIPGKCAGRVEEANSTSR
ncbi:hypothetical protein OQA88_13415 [Cercophora sp. LCS_1]